MSLPSKEKPETAVVAALGKDDLRSLFYFFAGKPDGTIKLFSGPFEMDLAAIDTLNARITDKLNNHHVEGVVASVYISYSNKTIKEFGSWAEFESHRWNGPEETEEVSVKWDFTVNLPQYQVPQRHTLTVRSSRGLRPAQALQWLLSQDAADSDPYGLAFSPMYCRVDFINPILGTELINLVSDWHAALKKPVLAPTWVKPLRRHRKAIEKTIQYSVPVAVRLACLGILRYLFSSWTASTGITVEILQAFGFWLVLSLIAAFLSYLIGELLADKAEGNLDKLAAVYPWFAFTNGDKNRNITQLRNSDKNVKNFLLTSAWAVALNVLAAYVAIKFGWG